MMAKHISISVTEVEFDAIARAAAAEGMKAGTWLRAFALNGIRSQERNKWMEDAKAEGWGMVEETVAEIDRITKRRGRPLRRCSVCGAVLLAPSLEKRLYDGSLDFSSFSCVVRGKDYCWSFRCGELSSGRDDPGPSA